MTFPPVARMPEPCPQPGIVENMPFEEYASKDALNASTIARFNESPKAGAAYLQEQQSPPTPAMQLGSALHCRVLEPDRFKELAIETDVGPAAEVAYRDAQKANPGKIILRKGWGDQIEAMAREVYAHPRAAAILNEPGPRELTIFWRERVKVRDEVVEVPCKARLDLFSPSMQAVIDFKKIRNGGGIYEAFQRAIVNYGYHLQAAWYARGAQRVGLCAERPDYAWVCVEEKAPHEIDLYQACDGMMIQGWGECRRGLYKYLRYRMFGEAPGRAVDVRPIALPNWAIDEELAK